LTLARVCGLEYAHNVSHTPPPPAGGGLWRRGEWPVGGAALPCETKSAHTQPSHWASGPHTHRVRRAAKAACVRGNSLCDVGARTNRPGACQRVARGAAGRPRAARENTGGSVVNDDRARRVEGPAQSASAPFCLLPHMMASAAAISASPSTVALHCALWWHTPVPFPEALLLQRFPRTPLASPGKVRAYGSHTQSMRQVGHHGAITGPSSTHLQGISSRRHGRSGLHSNDPHLRAIS